jgi:hypothetical protein
MSQRMSQSARAFRRIAACHVPLFAVLLLFASGCDNSDTLSPATDLPASGDPSEDAVAVEIAPTDAPTAEVSFAGGIPFGLSAQPTEQFNGTFNGALRNIYPQYLLRELAGIKARGGRVALNLAGGMSRYTDRDGSFNLDEWKAEVARFRNVNFRSYIEDGTIIGHYMIDEPHHASKYGGKAISGSTLEEMARYSKSLYPSMPTIARTFPDYLAKWGPYRSLDAAWAPYVYRFGDPRKFVEYHANVAKREGLALIVGLNVLKGGPNKNKMSASQVRDWGSALLSNSYPCAFISWKYDSRYLTSSVKDAMNDLRNKAESRSSKSCRGG